MKHRLLISTTAVALLFGPQQLLGQATTANLLAPPRDTLVCQTTSDTADVRRMIVKLFDDIAGGSRQITSVFDTTGNPLAMLVVLDSKASGDSLETSIIVARFFPDTLGTYSSTLPAGGNKRSLTIEELASVRMAAARVWGRRCNMRG